MRVLHVWSRLHCHWVRWRGTYAAWKLLPHALVIGCTFALTMTVIHVHTTPPAIPTPTGDVPQTDVPTSVYTAGIPQGDTPEWVWADYPSDYLGAGYRHHRCHKHCKGVKYTVPEPATWALMLAGVGMVGWRRRREFY